MDGGVLRPVVWTLQKVSLVSDTVSRCKKPCLTRITEMRYQSLRFLPRPIRKKLMDLCAAQITEKFHKLNNSVSFWKTIPVSLDNPQAGLKTHNQNYCFNRK